MTFRLTADRGDLAAEFKARPYGHHSPELEAALDQLRMADPDGKMILVCSRPGREWTVARLEGDPPRAIINAEPVFSSLEQAEWAVFKLRWKWLTGSPLDID